jgi:hypothetical protein
LVSFGITKYCYEKDESFEIFLGYHFSSEEVHGENVFAMQPVYGFDQRDDVTVFYKKPQLSIGNNLKQRIVKAYPNCKCGC